MDDQRTRLRALCADATERPWKTDGAVIVTNFDDEPTPLARAEMEPSPGVDADDVDYQDRANAALIVGAVNALPALLDALDDADARMTRADATLDDAGRRIVNLYAERNAARAERDDARAEVETLRAEAALLREQLDSPQRPRVGDVVVFDGNRCLVTAVDAQRFHAEDHDWRASIAPDWSEVEFARPVWIARLRGRGSAQGAKRGGAK